MTQWVGFAIFFSVVTALYGGAHYYLYSWFVRVAEPPKRERRILLYLFIFLVASFPISKILGWHDFNAFIYLLSFIASVWMVVIIFFKMIRFKPKVFAEQSLFYNRALVACIAGSVFIIGGFALQEARNLGVTRLEIPLRELPPELDGFALVQVSDVHYGMLTGNKELSKIVDRVNDLHPDIVVITGDLVDESVSHMEEMKVPLSRLKSRQGILAITGNHEYYAGVDRAVAIMEGVNIRVLRNAVQVLPGGLQILGIDDPTGYRRMGEPVPDFDRLVSRLDLQKPSILLYHQPILFDKAASCGVRLQLSGHTHGGQLFPIRYISKMIYPLTPGLHQSGDSYLYVSWGAGTWGPPMRLKCPPELVYIRLRSLKVK
ncbi:MAG: metallophosphoesterase [Thermodesulfobacteriota bacterium]